MFCGECGTQNPDTNRFCKNCGKELKRQSTAGFPVQAVPAPAPQPASQRPAAPAGAVKPARNWTAIAALIISLGSWLLYPVILGFFA
ncbi:MAG TPA: zinc ribbon domain-containing protein, partial [Methanoregula sp.]|nr:zinc ribbon domain-containing protein [Methanoregula sp.]